MVKFKQLFRPANTIVFLFALFLAAGVLLPQDVFASRIYLIPRGDVVRGQPIHVQVRIDTQGDEINAMEVMLEFPTDVLTFTGASDANSLINIWLERPLKYTRTSCDLNGRVCEGIRFSGLIPGGVVGEGLLSELTFIGKTTERADIKIDPSSKVVLNRSDGKLSFTVFNGVSLNIVGAVAEPLIPTTTPPTDVMPPEKFRIYIAKDDQAFSGRWFISFSTQDKETGVSSYTVQERWLGVFGASWHPADRNYELTDQKLFSLIRVRATDGAGNTQTETLVPRRLAVFYGSLGLLAIVAVLLWLARRLVRRLPDIPVVNVPVSG